MVDSFTDINKKYRNEKEVIIMLDFSSAVSITLSIVTALLLVLNLYEPRPIKRLALLTGEFCMITAIACAVAVGAGANFFYYFLVALWFVFGLIMFAYAGWLEKD